MNFQAFPLQGYLVVVNFLKKLDLFIPLPRTSISHFHIAASPGAYLLDILDKDTGHQKDMHQLFETWLCAVKK